MTSSPSIPAVKPIDPASRPAAVRSQDSASFRRELDAADRQLADTPRRHEESQAQPATTPAAEDATDRTDTVDESADDPVIDEKGTQDEADASAEPTANSDAAGKPTATPTPTPDQVITVNAGQPAPQPGATAATDAEAAINAPVGEATTSGQASAQAALPEGESTTPTPTEGKTGGAKANHGGAGFPSVASVPTDAPSAPAAPTAAAPAPSAATDAAPPAIEPPPPGADATDTGEQNVARLARGLRAAVQQNGGTMTLRLTPPELGEVRIQMQVTQNHVSASLQVEQDSVNALLSHRLGQLRHALESQGLVVDRLEVQTAMPRESSSDLGRAPDDGRSRGQLAQQQSQSRSRDGRSSGSGSARRQAFQQALIDSVA